MQKIKAAHVSYKVLLWSRNLCYVWPFLPLLFLIVRLLLCSFNSGHSLTAIHAVHIFVFIQFLSSVPHMFSFFSHWNPFHLFPFPLMTSDPPLTAFCCMHLSLFQPLALLYLWFVWGGGTHFLVTFLALSRR